MNNCYLTGKENEPSAFILNRKDLDLAVPRSFTSAVELRALQVVLYKQKAKCRNQQTICSALFTESTTTNGQRNRLNAKLIYSVRSERPEPTQLTMDVESNRVFFYQSPFVQPEQCCMFEEEQSFAEEQLLLYGWQQLSRVNDHCSCNDNCRKTARYNSVG